MGKIITADEKLISDFLKDCHIRGMTKGSINSYKSPLKIFRLFLKQKGLLITKITRNDIREYLSFLRDEKKIKQKSIENHFSALSSFYQFLVWEEKVKVNIILEVRKRYLRTYKSNNETVGKRKAISVDEMSTFINSIMDTRDKSMALLFAKTGVRRSELVNIDVDEVNWKDNSILLKPTPKRTNRTVYFDGECALVLRRWIKFRDELEELHTNALFVGAGGHRLKRTGVYTSIRKWAEKVGLFDKDAKEMSDRFSVHFFRHWFTTHLLRNGMPREYVQELRGDVRKDAIDVYDHIDPEDLRKKYLAAIPQLDIY